MTDDERRAYDRKRYYENREKKLAQKKEYYALHREEILEYKRKYREAHKEKFQKKDKKYYEEHKKTIKDYHRKYYSENKEKVFSYRKKIGDAHYQVLRALDKGSLSRKKCEICGASAEAHHDDYNKPLEVRWLCKYHHEEWHATHKPIYVGEEYV